MAKKTVKKKPAKKPAKKPDTKKKGTKPSKAKPAPRTPSPRPPRPSAQTFPELGNLKDPTLMAYAKGYADDMYAAEEALQQANTAKQSIRSRMQRLEATLFTAHGYEFTLVHGEDRFSARKVKRGAAPPDTMPAPEPATAPASNSEDDDPLFRDVQDDE